MARTSGIVRGIDRKFYEDFIMPSYLVGEKFDQLTVMQYVKRGNARNPNSAVWACQCDCGQGDVLASSSELRQGVKRCCPACEGPNKKTNIYRVLALSADGMSIREIQKRTGVSKSTVHRWIAGVKDAA